MARITMNELNRQFLKFLQMVYEQNPFRSFSAHFGDYTKLLKIIYGIPGSHLELPREFVAPPEQVLISSVDNELDPQVETSADGSVELAEDQNSYIGERRQSLQSTFRPFDLSIPKMCRIYFEENGLFMERGAGLLQLKPIRGSHCGQLMVRAINRSDFILNFIFHENIPKERSDRDTVTLICFPVPQADTPITIQIRMRTSEDIDRLMEKMGKFLKEH